MATAGLSKALADQIGPETAALHARGRIGIVIATTAHVAHARHHTLGARSGKCSLNPPGTAR